MSRRSKCSCRGYAEAAGEKSGSGLRCLKAPSLPSLGISEVLATKLALDALENFRAPSLEIPRCASHGLKYLPFRLFNTLDSCLFRGLLKDQVFLRWADILPSTVHGLTSKPGTRDTRITIDLQPALMYESSAEGIISVLIHHMAHAYFLACCGPPRDNRAHSEKQNLGHDLAYSTLIHKIMDVFRPQSLKRLPNLFLFDRTRRHHVNNHRQICRQGRSVSSLAEPGNCCTYYSADFLDRNICHDHALTLKELKPEQGKDGRSELGDPYPISHYIHVVNLEKQKLYPTLRTQYGSPPSDYIELHYGSYAIPFPRSKLRRDCSLASKLREDVNFLNIPAPSHQIFFAFYAYLLNGDYPPELVKATSPYLMATKAQGPPLISTYSPENDNYLVTDIKMFSLASMLDFSDLRDNAAERMYSLSETHANPILVLEEIYNSATRSDDDRNRLRRWVLEFLAKGNSQSGLTNLDILQAEQWGNKLSKLRKESGLFNMDYIAALESLVIKKAFACIHANSGEISTTKQPTEPPAGHGGKLSPAESEVLRQVHPEISKLYEKTVSSGQKSDSKPQGTRDSKTQKNDNGRPQQCSCHGKQQVGQAAEDYYQQSPKLLAAL
ncbi:hypothetical protein FQN49_000906 [Arthroderma sp. PD_2]|nr:hypothetical protein FQN49_000906 [Arthroderma sp. PD_2]